jgi:hypothetical protein
MDLRRGGCRLIAFAAFSRSPIVSSHRAGVRGRHSLSTIMTYRGAVGTRLPSFGLKYAGVSRSAERSRR